MQPSEVRQAIVAQHEELRGLLRSLDELARRAAEADDACVPALREIGIYAHDKLVEHLNFEDRYLVPAVRRPAQQGAAAAVAQRVPIEP